MQFGETETEKHWFFFLDFLALWFGSCVMGGIRITSISNLSKSKGKKTLHVKINKLQWQVQRSMECLSVLNSCSQSTQSQLAGWKVGRNHTNKTVQVLKKMVRLLMHPNKADQISNNCKIINISTVLHRSRSTTACIVLHLSTISQFSGDIVSWMGTINIQTLKELWRCQPSDLGVIVAAMRLPAVKWLHAIP